MRLFIAIPFDDEMKKALFDMQEELRKIGMTGRYVPISNLHLTLAFIGEYGNPDKVLDVMDAVYYEPVSIALDGVGHFGDLYWAGIAESDALKKYVKRLRRELANSGIPFDRKKFSPHITLVRSARYRGEESVSVLDIPKVSMVAESVSLFMSNRGKHGMIYTEF